MCGISGIITSNVLKKENDNLVKMTNIISHRGPDGFGYYQDGKVNFGHRRLSIIDVTDGGHQPMAYQEKYTITYNGEVYNYLEIKNTLKELGYKFQSESDTEVILAAYDKWGTDCVQHFNGMWAFAIHDTVKNIVFCSRDRFGVKPFYYSSIENIGFVFGSEIKQLLTFIEKPIANMKILLSYLVQNITNYSEETFFEAILELRGGHNLIFDLKINQFIISQYYSITIDDNIQNLSKEEAYTSFEKEFERAVNWRMRSDVKVGTCLSGGLDSSAIASFAANINKKLSDQAFCSITAQSTEEASDESHYAKLVGTHLGLEQHFTKPTIDDFYKNIDELIYTQEEPFVGPTVFMQYFVMKEARKNGIIVLLDGQAADESLLGYLRYIPTYITSKPWYRRTSALIEAKKNYGISFRSVIKNILYFTSPIGKKYYQIARLPKLKKEYKSLIDYSVSQDHAKAFKNLEELQKMELTKTQVPQLLRFEDKNSMRHGIETRLPFLDWNLVELMLSLNNDLKIKDGWSKYILRKTVETKLPNEIVWRRTKMNFNAPLSEWMEDKQFFFDAIAKSKILKTIFVKELRFDDITDLVLIWRLYNIAKWEAIYNVFSEN